MLSRRQVRTAIGWAFESPNLLLREANRVYHTRSYRRDYNPNGVDVVEEDWDNLVILDACRYDLFEAHHDLPGTLSARESRAAHTSEFIRGNFDGRDLTDTVYVSASPILQRGYRDRYDPDFHAIINVWREDGWDDECNSVRPETMVEYASEAAEQFPHKRLVVHFMQPHYPFIGSDMELDKQSVPDPEELTTDIWHEMMRNHAGISEEEIAAAYRSNLTVALPHVERLVRSLSGKTVVTSDHGNMLGERSRPIPIREWGHPDGVYTSELVTVPWLECPADTRRDIVAEPSESSTDGNDEELVRDRLRQLGYAE
jgi:hypothetical protein